MTTRTTRLLNHKEIRTLLPMADCIDVVADALQGLAAGDAALPLRSIVWLPEKIGALGSMPSTMGNQVFGSKVISVFPGNASSPYDSHQGVVLLFEGEHGRLVAILDATEITAIRTAAASGLATRTLARKDAGDLAILGTGAQARTHLQAMAAVRELRRVRVWSRSGRGREFADSAAGLAPVLVEVVDSAMDAVQGADLVCTVTDSKEPVLRADWLSPGAHLNAVGACTPNAREVDSATMARASLFTDCRESFFHEPGDFLIARQEGMVTDEALKGELGEVLVGTVEGRTSDEEITLFESLGISIEDLAAAQFVYERAKEHGRGTTIELGAMRGE